MENNDPTDVSRFLPLAFLAPDIVEAIVQYRQPLDLSSDRSRLLSPIPVEWGEQSRRLGFDRR